jgi:hypothetical protein
LSEAELTLDVALRLEKLLLRQPGVEVIQTRRTNAFVPLEERTEIANRSGADIFLSIHANASADGRARGVETYFLNFAPSAEAEAIAARENAASTRSMRQLPELVRAIALNNKLDESRDLARLVQESLYSQARKSDKRARNLGVKQAPFMVLVGAQMPSILTEISFLDEPARRGAAGHGEVPPADCRSAARGDHPLSAVAEEGARRRHAVRRGRPSTSDSQLRVRRVGLGRSLPPFVENDSARDQRAADRRREQEDTCQREDAEHRVDAGVLRGRRLLGHVDDDGILL